MIKAFWWKDGPGSGNFGDQLTPLLCRYFSGQTIEWAPAHEADLIAVGSVLDKRFWPDESWRTFEGHIWGSGRMTDDGAIEFPKASIAALRGRLTAERLGDNVPDGVVLGEPGLLVQMLARPMNRRYKLGLIPHWSQREDPLFTSLAKRSSEIALIDVCEPVQSVIDQASRCEAILASALHGLIWRILWAFRTSGCDCRARGGMRWGPMRSSIGITTRCLGWRTSRRFR